MNTRKYMIILNEKIKTSEKGYHYYVFRQMAVERGNGL